jgi:hypothetical protein
MAKIKILLIIRNYPLLIIIKILFYPKEIQNIILLLILIVMILQKIKLKFYQQLIKILHLN